MSPPCRPRSNSAPRSSRVRRTGRASPPAPTPSSSRPTRTRSRRSPASSTRSMAAGAFNRYPDASALAAARGARRRGTGSPPDQVHVGSGSVSLLSQFIAAAAGPGDEVVYPGAPSRPTRASSRSPAPPACRCPNRAGRTARPAGDGRRRHRPHPRRDRLLPEQPDRRPSSPRPSSTAFMAAVPPTCSSCSTRHTPSSSPTRMPSTGSRLLGRYPNLVVLRTFSKAYGLAGLRVGYAHRPRTLLDAARATAIPLSVTAAGAARGHRRARARAGAARAGRRASARGATDLRAALREPGLGHPAAAGQLRLAGHRRRRRPRPTRPSSRHGIVGARLPRRGHPGLASARTSLWTSSSAAPAEIVASLTSRRTRARAD